MTLVEHFIEISNWPTSRKVAFWCGGFLIPMHLLAWLVTHYFGNAQIQMINITMLDWLVGAWTGTVVLSFLISLPAAIAGREGWGLEYIFVTIYCPFAAACVYLFGSASTATIAFIPGIGFLMMIFFDERVGWFALLYMIVMLIVVAWLESAGVLPYAPILLDRTIDAQHNDIWQFVIYYVVFQAFILVSAFCTLVVMARRLQESRLNDAHRQLERSDRLIRRYVPSQIADAILAGGEETTEKHERRKLTIFFSDLVGFTEIAEELEPEDLSRVLNEYFADMTTIAQRHGGTVDELSGDAILIFFGAPNATNDKDHALRAVRMAVEMQEAMDALNARWRGAGIGESLTVRMGINTGVVTIGNFGSPERMKYAALGKHVNLAARLQAHCEPGKVLLSHATWLLVHEEIPCIEKGEMQLKGIHKPVAVYELTLGR